MSHRAPVANWNAPASTYLAICTAIANLAMRYACIQGVVIAWWYRASRNSSLTKLHYDWRAGTTLRGALTSGRHIGLLGLACTASTLVVVDGPLLQLASTVRPGKIDRPVPLNVTMAAQIPTGFTGDWQAADNLGLTPFWSPSFNSTMPTSGGTTPNNIYTAVTHGIESSLYKAYIGDIDCSSRCCQWLSRLVRS